MPPGDYELEVAYQTAAGVATNRETGVIHFSAPVAAAPVLNGTASTSGVAVVTGLA